MPSVLSTLNVLSKKNKIYDFGRIPMVMDVPYLLETQKKSYEDFLQKDLPPKERKDIGLQEAFTSIFPITSPSTPSTLNFEEYNFGVPKYSIKECTERGMTFSVPLKVKLQLMVREMNEATGQVEIRDIKEQEAYMGETPIMTEQGTFIINGAERVIVSQLHRSPGVSFSSSIHPNGKTTYSARVIPYRGAWIEFEIDISNVMNVIVDRRRKIPATAFLRILGLSTDQEIAREFFDVEPVGLDDFKKGATKLADLPRFVGESIVEEVPNPKTGKRMASPGTKVTKKLIEQFKQAGVKKVVLNVAEAYDNILGRYLAEDVVDTTTGEILGECFDEVTTVFLMKCAESKIGECKVIKVQHEDTNVVLCTLAKDKSKNREDAFIEFFRKMRPGNPISLQAATRLVDETFFNEKRYDLGLVGRHKIANRFKEKSTPETCRTLTCEDVVSIMKHMLRLVNEETEVDDIDHLGNRRVRSVGELLQNHVRMALAEVEKTARERMGIIDLENMLPHNLINSKPVDSAIKDFFGRSQLSQFMDQTNPLSELTHKRRLSALGPGGLSRDRAGFEVRDVHHTHYGRICPIETPEGPNIGLISSLSTYARVNLYGFIETPYRRVVGGKVTKDINYLTADIEDEYRIAQANAPIDEDGNFQEKLVQCRFKSDYVRLESSNIDYMDISPKQVISVSAALIPFLENDDANRALMGSNMMRQGVPLLYTDFPVVGTGMESRVAQDSGVTILARNAGEVIRSTSTDIIIRNDMGEEDHYPLVKFRRSNQNTCINQKPIVFAGDKVKRGDVLADGPATRNGVLALGRNILVAFMPWGGYNYEDAIIISERLVKEDVYTSVHIEEFEIDARDTKLGKEDITRDIPNVSEEALAKLDDNGLVYAGAEVKPGDILVGKVTPKGETELTSEEKLLRVIFGEKAGDVRDASLRCPPGTQGIVVDIKVFSRKERTSASDRMDKEAIGAIDLETESQISRLWADFTDKLANLLEDIDKPIVTYDGSTVLKPGAKVTDKVVQYVRNSLRTGVHPVTGEVGAKVKALYQDFANREFAIEEVAKNQKDRIKTGDELPPGVIKLIKVYVATKRKISIGDKMAGRHGNKGVISKILPVEDMPFLEDGTPVDIILNPLGVPSRMNVGQILETHLGWAADKLGFRVATPVFDGAREEQIRSLLREAGLPETGQAVLFDGLTGEPFSRPVTVGVIYMLKLAHMVDDKMHARSIGPYSLVTQQPLGGKAQFGGQRFGEMEVWALEAYGAANTLQELLTVKSDDVVGRTKIYESIIKGHNALSPGVPESFNVLVKELQGLCLNMELLSVDDLRKSEFTMEEDFYGDDFDEAEIDEDDLHEMDAFGLDDADEAESETEEVGSDDQDDEE